MGTFRDHTNPFVVKTPEDMSAEDTKSLFVDVFSDFPKVREQGHLFLHGPRGSGKSMMFRYLQPDCKRLVHNCAIRELPFFSIYIPVKNTDMKLTELGRLEGQHASALINEHFMVMHIAEKAFASMAKLGLDETDHAKEEARRFHEETLCGLLHDFGWQGSPVAKEEHVSVAECFGRMASVCRRVYLDLTGYIKKLSFGSGAVPYDGPLCGYTDFLYPLFCQLKGLSFMPKGPLYLLLDDADNLSLTQTRILNTWVSSRTSSNVSIKVSTQLRYKTYRTVTGLTIGAPHDFSEINIATVYTASKKATYGDRLREIVRRRLKLADIPVEPEQFFPLDEEQEAEIRKLAAELRERWKEKGRGYRPNDDAYRYARPDYIKSLAGTSKSSSSYSYAGFEHLVHVSSGIIRFFLEPAALMYGEAQARTPDQPAVAIPSGIQDQVIRQFSDDFLFIEFEKMLGDQSEGAPPADDLNKLRNLIRALGGTFHQILLSERSERRVFSIAFSDTPDEEIKRILNLGSALGYFHVSAVGNKDGTGRTALYVLSRRLAPHFKLDPTSFAGYLFVRSENVKEALANPDRLLRQVKDKGVEVVFESRQGELF